LAQTNSGFKLRLAWPCKRRMTDSDPDVGGTGTQRRPLLERRPTYDILEGVDNPELKVPAEVMHVSQRYRAPSMLMFGASSSLFAFCFVTSIGIIDYRCQTTNIAYNITYPSGNGYWPSTVSEMVHNTQSPAGKVFTTFGMIAGASIFVSMYPTHLRNVYTFEERVPVIGIYWTSFRQVVPAMGIWLLVGVNTYPMNVATESKGYTKMFCVALHLVGAGMLFVGYMFAELHNLGIWPFSRPKTKRWPEIEPPEMRTRRCIAYVITVAFALFGTMQVVILAAQHYEVCCPDEWKAPGEKIGDDIVRDAPQIVNTASGTYLWLKVASYLFEDVAGMALVLSHLAIWWFSEERHVDYGKSKLACVHYQDPNK